MGTRRSSRWRRRCRNWLARRTHTRSASRNGSRNDSRSRSRSGGPSSSCPASLAPTCGAGHQRGASGSQLWPPYTAELGTLSLAKIGQLDAAVPKVALAGTIFQAVYGELLAALRQMGYEDDPPLGQPRTLWVFPYDWTQSCDDSGKQLAAFIANTVMQNGSCWDGVDIVNHSMGGVITRAARELHGAPILRSAYIASPHNGALDAYLALHPAIGLPFFDRSSRSRFWRRSSIPQIRWCCCNSRSPCGSPPTTCCPMTNIGRISRIDTVGFRLPCTMKSCARGRSRRACRRHRSSGTSSLPATRPSLDPVGEPGAGSFRPCRFSAASPTCQTMPCAMPLPTPTARRRSRSRLTVHTPGCRACRWCTQPCANSSQTRSRVNAAAAPCRHCRCRFTFRFNPFWVARRLSCRSCIQPETARRWYFDKVTKPATSCGRTGVPKTPEGKLTSSTLVNARPGEESLWPSSSVTSSRSIQLR